MLSHTAIHGVSGFETLEYTQALTDVMLVNSTFNA